ncbi:Membrane fusion component of tripartite multidrug resistance system [hydrothermal vent metagenome]|uniref:Membrane fusion component of tripartite multidrug resistance system n=1 Tax=hydrothermal vent metagenome TaxID=652676 RepID=A0A1W1C9J4_9ZZZZ
MSIRKEKNLKRKALRVSVPLSLQIDGAVYETNDWSMSGFGLNVKNRKHSFVKGVNHKAQVILNMGEAVILIDLEIEVKNINSDSVGFEITHINDKNRRVLRHFLTLSLDGKGNNLDDLVSDFTIPVIETPIEESILLNDSEQNLLKRSFAKKAYFYIVSMVALLTLATFVIIYNAVIIYNGYGVTTGNNINITTVIDGKVDKIYIKRGSKVKKGQLLFSISDTIFQNNFENLSKDILLIEKQLNRVDASIKNINSKIYKLDRDKNRSLREYKEDFDVAKRRVEEASKLYQTRLITYSDYSAEKLAYLKSKELMDNLLLTTDLKEKFGIENIYKEKNRLTELLQEKRLLLKAAKINIESCRVFANNDGVVHALKIKEKQFLKAGDLALILESQERSYILMKMISDKVINVHVGQKVLIYSSKTEKNYYGRVSAIGYSSSDVVTNTLMEVAKNEILVQIDFDSNQTFPLNTPIETWILNEKSYYFPIIGILYDKKVR